MDFVAFKTHSSFSLSLKSRPTPNFLPRDGDQPQNPQKRDFTTSYTTKYNQRNPSAHVHGLNTQPPKQLSQTVIVVRNARLRRTKAKMQQQQQPRREQQRQQEQNRNKTTRTTTLTKNVPLEPLQQERFAQCERPGGFVKQNRRHQKKNKTNCASLSCALTKGRARDRSFSLR